MPPQVVRHDGGNPDALLRLATFSFLVGNTDLHAKNLSFLRLPDGRVRLAPAYDIAMHLHHPRADRRFALDVNGKHRVSDVTVDDLVREGVSWGLPPVRAARVVADAVHDTADALAVIDRVQHPGVCEAAWSQVASRIDRAAAQLPNVVPAGRSAPAPVPATRPARRGPRRPRP
ncbi:MAG: HipA domain-containing protein [Angustibacter sp.]